MAPHPAAPRGIFLPGVEGLELRQLGQELCSCLEPGAGHGPRVGCWGTVLTFLEAHQNIGLEFAGHFRASLWDVFAEPPSLTCQFCIINPEAERDQLEVGLASLWGQHWISRSSLEDFLM